MNYSRNAIYTRIVNAIRAQYPNTYCTSRLVAKPSTFPACYIHEIDRNRPLQFTQIDFQDSQYESVFEIQVVSAKANTASTEAMPTLIISSSGSLVVISCIQSPGPEIRRIRGLLLLPASLMIS